MLTFYKIFVAYTLYPISLPFEYLNTTVYPADDPAFGHLGRLPDVQRVSVLPD